MKSPFVHGREGNISQEFRDNFLTGQVDFVGKCRRFVKYSEVEVKNTSFEFFINTNNLLQSFRGHEQDYRMIIPAPSLGFRSIAKYDRVQPKYDCNAMDMAQDWALRHWYVSCAGSKIVSVLDAKNNLQSNSATGYPLGIKYPNKGKFKDSDDFVLCEEYFQSLKCSPNHIPIWTASQKYEMRSKEKIDKRRVRTFTASPVEHTYALNRMCLDFNERFYKSRDRTWSFVGTSKFFRGFHRLVNRLQKHKKCYAMDETDYDASLFADLLWRVMLIRWECYRVEDKTPENWGILIYLYESIIHSWVILENGEVIWKHTGNPSGSANTIVDNTLALYIILAYAWILITRGTKWCTYHEYHDNVEGVLNGDDNNFSVSDLCNKYFNPDNILGVWRTIGVTATPEFHEPKLVHELTFLSQTFTNFGGVWLPSPETVKVLCSILWGAPRDDVRWHMLRACALRMDSWANIELRDMISAYIQFLWDNYSENLVGSFDGISMKDVEGVWKSDHYLFLLYTGYEGVESVKDLSPFKNFDVTYESFCWPQRGGSEDYEKSL